MMKSEDILQAILSILAIDGTLEQQELQFFDKMCQELALSQEKRREMLDDVKQGKGRIHIPEGKDDRKQLLFYLLQAAFADGKIVPKEKHIIKSAAHKMGIEQHELDKHIHAMLKEIEASAQPAAMSCPKCGFEQARSGRCTRCGIFIKNYRKQQEKQRTKTQIAESSQTESSTPRLSGLPLFTKQVGLEISKFPRNYHCSWPLGTLQVYQDRWQFDMLVRKFTLFYVNVTNIKRVLFHIRIEHNDPEVLKNVRLSGYNLYRTLKDANEQYDFGWPIV